MKKVSGINKIRRNLLLRELVNHRQLSFTDLKLHTGISLPVVSGIINKLKNEGLVSEVKDKEIIQAGRPPSIVN